MNGILFDAETGRLRLDRVAFDGLIGWAAGQRPEELPELRAAGLTDGRGTLHPDLRPKVDAVINPVCRVRIRVQDMAGRQQTHDGWVSSAVASLLLAPNGEDGVHELVGMHPTFLPEAIARLVGLGPRPRSADVVPVLLSPTVLDDLTDPDAGRRSAATNWLRSTAAGSTEQATAEALGEQVVSRWEAVATWDADRNSSGRRGLHVIDTPAMVWLVEPLGGGLMASPSTPSAVWRLLTTLLPRDDELYYPPGRQHPARPTLDGV